MNKLLMLPILTVMTGCAGMKNQDIGLGADGTVSAYNNLDRHAAITLFQTQKGKACYEMIQSSIEFTLSEQVQSTTPAATGSTNQYDAFIAQSQAMERLAIASMENAAKMVAYSNGIVPQDPIVQLASMCKENNYYDMQIATQAERQATFRSISSNVFDTVKSVAPYVVMAELGRRIGDRTTISGDNSASGTGNGVADPTVVNPTIVEPAIVPAGAAIQTPGVVTPGVIQ